MSSIYKLSISGIRSFSDETQETIQFNGPLTLIVGTNGSGKTTIIECLKYATTNELPPNTKNGASFINDPNLHSSNETKAQIKLAFKSTKKLNMILSKSLMALKNPKTNNISFKTKENQLMIIHGNEKQTISSKIADIEKLIPNYLGTSKTILNYVVFCHQDDNLWPISESSVLKKKFDEIFDSTKFIKILDNLKIITKEINNDTKIINNNVNHFKNDKIKYLNKINSKSDIDNQILQTDDSMNELNLKLNELNEKLNLLYNSNQDYEKILSKLDSLENDKKLINQNIETTKLTTEILHKPFNELQDDLSNFTNILTEQMNKSSNLSDQIESNSNNLTSYQNDLNNLLLSFGNLKSLKLKYNDNLIEKDKLTEKFKNDLNLSESSTFLDFDNKLDTNLRVLKNQLDDRMSNFNTLITDLENKLLNFNTNKTKESQYNLYMNVDLKNLNRKISEFESKLQIISNNQFKIENLKNELINKKNEYEKFKELNDISKINEKIFNKSNNLNKLESEIDENQRKISLLMKTSDINSKIKLLNELNKKSLDSKNLLLKEIKSFQPFTKLSNDEILSNNNDILNNLEVEFNKSNRVFENLKNEKNLVFNKLTNIERNIENNKLNLLNSNEKFNEIQNDFKNIYNDNINLNNFDEMLTNIKDNFEEDFQNQNEIQLLIKYNDRAINFAENKENCLLCKRKFDKANLLPFINLLKKNNEKYKLKTDIDKLNERKINFEKLNNFKSEINQIFKLQNEIIPELEDDEKKNREALNEIEEKLNNSELELNEKRNDFNKMKSLQYQINSINQINKEIDAHNNEINDLKSSVQSFNFNFDFKIEDLEHMNNENFKNLKVIREELEILRVDKDLKNTQNNKFLNDLNNLKLNIQDYEMKSLDKINIEKAIEEAQTQIDELKNNLAKSDIKINEIDKEITGTEKLLNEERNSRDEYLRNIKEKILFYENIKNQFKKIDENINEYKKNDIERKYKECDDKVFEKKEEISKTQNLIKNEREELKKLETILSDSKQQERNIRSNINLIHLEDELQEIEETIITYDKAKALAQREEYIVKSNELQKEQTEIQKNIAIKLGIKSQLEKQLKDIDDEIERDYKDVNEKYLNEYSKLQTKLALATDLTTLYKITDNSIIEFHKSKMLKINNIIDELWKKTYMGNDVESIMIKSDPIAIKKSTITANNNRSYNYRVVMVKNGTELDMRGRCSAGQKVLASIIIRIALSECFCLNFGMITLDEPTTNLDDENIESLAKSLHSIIQERRTQKNFQLIIITHDEKFLRCMNAVDFADHYYKVIRDERLNSTIRKVKISSVTE